MSGPNNTHTTTKTIISLFLAFLIIAGTIITTSTVSVYGQGQGGGQGQQPVTRSEFQAAVNQLQQTDADLQAAIDQLQADFEAALVQLQQTDADLQAAIDQLQADFEAALVQLQQTDTDLQAAIDQLQQTDVQLQAAIDQLQQTDAQLQQTDAQLQQTDADLQAAIDQLQADFEAALVQLQQVLNQIEECPAGTIYEGFFVNGDGDPNTTVPEDEVMTEICIPTAQLNVMKTTTCDVEEFGQFGQVFCDSIRDSIREPKISVLGNNPTPSFFFGTESPGTSVSLGSGAYHVDETGFTEGLEPCKTEGFDGGRNLVGDGIFICTDFSDECQGDITIGSLQTCTIDNNVLVEQNFLDLDLAVANTGSNTISILLGDGDGTFGTATTFPAAGDTPTSVAVGDFNGDDVFDIATANFISHDISILLGNGDGTFGTATTLSPGALNPRFIAVADFNGDDKLDIVTSNRFSHNVSILLGNGDGTFGTATTYPVAPESGPHEVTLGDFNGDDVWDIATANEVSDTVSILLGNGDGTFGTATTLPSGGLSTRYIAVGDFNGDDKLDIATSNTNSDNISILLGNGDGTFGTATTFPVAPGSVPLQVAVGDFNGDDKLDIATANLVTNNISILLGNGDGTFGTATTLPVGLNPTHVAVGDFNGDDVLDIAVSNSGSTTISILLGNGDGTFGTATNFNAGGGPGPIAVGEFD